MALSIMELCFPGRVIQHAEKKNDIISHLPKKIVYGKSQPHFAVLSSRPSQNQSPQNYTECMFVFS